MERKNTLLLTVIAIATLLVAVVGATFAYFATQLDNTANGLNVTANTEAATAVFLASGSDISLNVTGLQMAQSRANNSAAVLANNTNTTLNVTFAAGTTSATYSCTYDIVFKWTGSGDSYLYSAVTKPTPGWTAFGKEFTIAVGNATVTGWTDSGENITSVTGIAEKNIAFDGECTDSGNAAVAGATSYETCVPNDESTNTWTEGSVMTLVSGAKIYSNTAQTPANCTATIPEGQAVNATNCDAAGGTFTPASGGTVVSWPIDLAFYNLDLHQEHLAGKSFAGRVEVANVVC